MLINTNKSFCYRICHIQNLPHALKFGLCTKHHANASANFISIGNPAIIGVRDATPVRLKGYGCIGEYVPFYFTPKSMMLFNIVTGYQAPLVPQLPKEDILVIRCLIEDVSKANKFFFTDGQANVKQITTHYNNLADLDKIDWTIIQNGDFKKSNTDTDKQRRYQAEFLIYNHVPIQFVESLHVYNAKAATFVQQEIAKTGLLTPVKTTPQYFF